MIILDHEQGTEEWLAARLGRPSASCFSRLITNSGKPSSSADGYINELIAERLTGRSKPFFTTPWMERGTELEPEAREAYEFISGNETLEVGFIVDPTFSYGCSPDALIGTDGGLEIKCPAPDTHVGYMRDNQAGVNKYWQQIQGCMMITGRSTWDFLAYHPEMEPVLVTVEYDEEFCSKMYDEIVKAVTIINEQCEELA